MPLAIPTGDDPGKGSMAMGTGKRSLPASLRHLGQFSHLPSAIQQLRASEPSPEASGAPQSFPSPSKYPKRAGGTQAGKFRSSWPRVTTEASPDTRDMQLLDPSPFHPRSQPGLEGRTGKAGDSHEQEPPTHRLLCFPHRDPLGTAGHFSFHET